LIRATEKNPQLMAKDLQDEKTFTIQRIRRTLDRRALSQSTLKEHRRSNNAASF